MSKRTRKKQTQTANYLTLSAQEQSPQVGSIVEYKNTIIVKKITGGGVEIFYTDQNGKVMQSGQVPANTEPPEINLTMEDIVELIKQKIKNELPTAEPQQIESFTTNNEQLSTPIKTTLVKQGKLLSIMVDNINPEFGTFGEKMLLGHQNLINIEKDKVIFVSAGIFYLNKDGSVEFMVVATAGTSEFSVSTQIILN